MERHCPDAGLADVAPRRRTSTIRTSAPDWLFSAVIHLLLIALLLTSKAGPGGGGGGGGGGAAGSLGNGQGGGGSTEFPGSGWIESQIGVESAWKSSPSIAIDPAPEPQLHKVHEASAVPVTVEIGTTAKVASVTNEIQQVAYSSTVQPEMADKRTDDSSSTFPPSTEARPGNAGGPSGGGDGGSRAGQGPGDGSPGFGGNGRGGTSLFGIWDSGERIVYVIDRSRSMEYYEKLVAARQELEASLAQLDDSFEFQVLYYNQHVQPLSLNGSRGLIRASVVNKNRVRSQIQLISADGGTRHRAALQAAIGLHPTVLYFLTDAENEGLTADEIAALGRRLRGQTRVHCIQFGELPGQGPTSDNWLQRLAAATGGKYVHYRTEALQRSERPPASFR